jgi:hypothetical protein
MHTAMEATGLNRHRVTSGKFREKTQARRFVHSPDAKGMEME